MHTSVCLFSFAHYEQHLNLVQVYMGRLRQMHYLASLDTATKLPEIGMWRNVDIMSNLASLRTV